MNGLLQDLQRPHLRGVAHGTPSAGRSCWYGRYGLFSAGILPMRLASHDIGNLPTSLELSLSSTSRRPWGRGAGSCKLHHTIKSSWRAITPSGYASMAVPASRSCNLPRVHTVPDMTCTEHLSVSTGQGRLLGNPISCTIT
jgi:hypothetical protein